MSATSPNPVARVNLLAPSGAAPTTFAGEQRVKARTVLAAKILERQVTAVMQLVQKDPSLALDTVPMTLAGGGVSRVEDVDFAVACLQHGITPGYLMAVNQGYDVNKALPDGMSLLDIAVSQMPQGNAEANVSLLLALGANPNGTRAPDKHYQGTFCLAMANAYPAKQTAHQANVIMMLLDAKAVATYPASYKSPLSLLVSTGGWGDAARDVELTKMMARLVKAGASLEEPSGSPRLSPMRLAIGSKNGNALVALVRLGAETAPEALDGRELFAEMDANGLAEFKPIVQRALMERVIAKGKSTTVAESLTEAAPESRRRRMGAI